MSNSLNRKKTLNLLENGKTAVRLMHKKKVETMVIYDNTYRLKYILVA